MVHHHIDLFFSDCISAQWLFLESMLSLNAFLFFNFYTRYWKFSDSSFQNFQVWWNCCHLFLIVCIIYLENQDYSHQLIAPFSNDENSDWSFTFTVSTNQIWWLKIFLFIQILFFNGNINFNILIVCDIRNVISISQTNSKATIEDDLMILIYFEIYLPSLSHPSIRMM